MNQQTDPSSDAVAPDNALIEGLESEADDNAVAQSASPTESSSDDPLADQIQEMLDASRQQQETALTEAVDTAGETDVAKSQGDTADEDLDAIDKQLAAEADELLAGDFESVDEVVGSPVKAQSPKVVEFDPMAQTPPAAQAAVQSPIDDDINEIAGDFAAPEAVEGEIDMPLPADMNMAAAETTDNDADIVAGDFHAPDDVATQSATESKRETTSAGDFSATADDVAAELDGDLDIEGSFSSVDDTVEEPTAEMELPIPAPMPFEAPPRSEIVGATTANSVTGNSQVTPRKPIIHIAKDLLHKTCCAISRPVTSVNDEWRNIIGYAGVVTLFNFSVLMLYKLATTLLG